MTATSTVRRPTTTPRSESFAAGAAGGVDQVPHGPGLGDRRRRRRGAVRAFTFLVANGNTRGWLHRSARLFRPELAGTDCYAGHPFVPTGPDGEAVADSY